MKHLYLLTALLGLSVTATAAVPVAAMTKGKVADELPANREFKSLNIADKQQAMKKLPGVAAKAPGKDIQSIVGTYTWTYYDLFNYDVEDPYDADPVYDMVTINILDESTGQVKITNLLGYGNVVGTYDSEWGSITIPNQVVGYSEAYGDDIIFSLVSDAGESVEGDLVLGYNKEEDLWVAYDSYGFAQTYNERVLGFYAAGSVALVEEVDPDFGWTSLGDATFVDPWVIPAFGGEPSDYPWKVELQQNDSDANVYRLVNPYRTDEFPLAYLNESGAINGYIQFNVSDPEHVYFDLVDAGFAYSKLGITELYCYNNLTWAMNWLGCDASTVVNWFSSQVTLNTYFKDDVLTIGTPELNDAVFGYQDDKLADVVWVDSEGAAAPMYGSVTFPVTSGIKAVETAGTDAPVEYFNLQGVRVDNPSNGIFISRQGNVTKKVIR